MAPTPPVDDGAAHMDGRAVAYRRYGADPGPGVPVVLSCHGGLSCGADAALGHDVARDRGVSILAVDRPGVAGSGDLPGRTTGSFASDAGAVLDHLGIDRTLGAVGWSLGGQYALALAALLADRVPAAAVVAGVPPLSWTGVRRALSTTDRVLLGSVGARVPGVAADALFRMVRREAARTAERRTTAPPGAAPGRMVLRTWGAADAAVLAGPAGTVIDDAVAEATTSVPGMQEEYRAWRRDWGFEPADIGVPVVIWQGDRDHWVPEALAGRLAAAIPGATIRRCPGQGHLLLAGRWGEVLDDLAGLDTGRSAT